MHFMSNVRSVERHVSYVPPGPDLPIGWVGSCPGPQDPRGPPANCGTHWVNCW